DRVLEGLDARDTWAPLLRPGVLMDVDAFGRWERRVIESLTGESMAPWHALDRVEAATGAVLEWNPVSESGSLASAVDRAFESPSGATRSDPPDGERARIVREAVAFELRPSVPDDIHVRLRDAAG